MLRKMPTKQQQLIAGILLDAWLDALYQGTNDAYMSYVGAWAGFRRAGLLPPYALLPSAATIQIILSGSSDDDLYNAGRQIHHLGWIYRNGGPESDVDRRAREKAEWRRARLQHGRARMGPDQAGRDSDDLESL